MEANTSPWVPSKYRDEKNQKNFDFQSEYQIKSITCRIKLILKYVWFWFSRAAMIITIKKELISNWRSIIGPCTYFSLRVPLSSTQKTFSWLCWTEGFLVLNWGVFWTEGFFGIELRGFLVELRDFEAEKEWPLSLELKCLSERGVELKETHFIYRVLGSKAVP